MNFFNLFVKKKQAGFSSNYNIDPQEYISQNQISAQLRSFYTYIKIIFLLLFSAGFALSFIPIYFFIAAAILSLWISFHFLSHFIELLDSRQKLFTYMIIPLVCITMGFVFGLALSARIAEI